MNKIAFTLILALVLSPCLFAMGLADPLGILGGLLEGLARFFIVGYLIIIAILVGVNYDLRKRTALAIRANKIFCLVWIALIVAMRLSIGEIHIMVYFILGIPIIVAIVGIMVALCNIDESQESQESRQDKNSVDYYALVNASNSGELQHLIASGADINAKNDFGNTALMTASNNGNVALVECLLANGADVHIKNDYDKTALDLANSKAIQEILRKAGAE